MSLTHDTLFGGALALAQPARGHRIGTDAVLLAAACPPAARRIVDFGCGAGAVGLRAAQMSPAAVALVDIDADMLALADVNAAANGIAAACRTVQADAMARGFPAPALGLANWADTVLTNPPFAEAGRGNTSPDPARARAHVLVGPLETWVKGALACLGSGGALVMIHRADAVPAILAAMSRRFGGLRLRFIHPQADAPAHRVLVLGRKGSRAPLAILPPLVLHEPGGAFTPQAAALHSGAATLDWGMA